MVKKRPWACRPAAPTPFWVAPPGATISRPKSRSFTRNWRGSSTHRPHRTGGSRLIVSYNSVRIFKLWMPLSCQPPSRAWVRPRASVRKRRPRPAGRAQVQELIRRRRRSASPLPRSPRRFRRSWRPPIKPPLSMACAQVYESRKDSPRPKRLNQPLRQAASLAPLQGPNDLALRRGAFGRRLQRLVRPLGHSHQTLQTFPVRRFSICADAQAPRAEPETKMTRSPFSKLKQ